MKKLSVLFIALTLVFTSCSNEEVDNAKESSENALTINGKEYEINKVMSYFEANDEPADFYFFDLAILTEGMSFNFSSGDTFVDGTGSILAFTLISETSLIKDGDYLQTTDVNADEAPC